MCGICGFFGEYQSVQGKSEIIGSMMNKLHHRGPDDEGKYIDNSFAFGHKRLEVIDLAGGAQPFVSEDGRYVLVYNGEIYNYVELREQLVKKGVTFKSVSDTEVLLQALISYKEKAFDLLNGMFAFAFIDRKTNDWILARDNFGIKPVYYADTGKNIVFASEIKALFEHPDVSASVNKAGFDQYLTFQFCLGAQTMFQNVFKVEPGHYIKGNGNRIISDNKYWEISYEVDTDHTEDYFRRELYSLLEHDIKIQTRSDVPFGTYLSGGVDSSIITSFVSKILGSEFTAYHGKFSESSLYDESEYAEALQNRYGFDLDIVAPSAEEFIEAMPELIRLLDEPVAGPGVFPQYIVSRQAAKKVKVILGGQGGDEIFGGYARYLVGYLEQAIKGSILETQDEGEHIVTLSSIIPNLPVLKQYVPMMQSFWSEGLFSEMDARYFRLIDRSPTLNRVLSRDALEDYCTEGVFEEYRKVFNHPNTQSYINKMTNFDTKTLLPALLQVEDRVSMASSLESRVPLLDKRVVSLLTSMPPNMKFKAGRTKYILKETTKKLLPDKIISRKDKMGFPVPLSEWIAGNKKVSEFVCDTLLGKKARERGLFNISNMEESIHKLKSFDRQIWGMLCLELWLETYID